MAKSLNIPHFKPNYKNNIVFDDMEEGQLQNYLFTASKHHHSLTTVETRKLAFQFARKNNKKTPPGWEAFQIAGSDWFHATAATLFY